MPPISQPYIVDVEASGLGPGSYPIEIGLALWGEKRYCSLIKPDDRWQHWDSSAEELHNISRNTLNTRGKPIPVVAHELNSLLHGKTVYSDGWVVDEPWIIRLFESAGVSKQFTIYDLQTILSEKQMEIWHDTKQHVITDLQLTRHRASNDARIVQETFKRTQTF